MCVKDKFVFHSCLHRMLHRISKKSGMRLKMNLISISTLRQSLLQKRNRIPRKREIQVKKIIDHVTKCITGELLMSLSVYKVKKRKKKKKKKKEGKGR